MRQRWDVDELVESWTLDAADFRMVRNKTGPTRLGFSVCLKYFELEARGLTPLVYSHINPYGTFKLDLNTRLALAT